MKPKKKVPSGRKINSKISAIAATVPVKSGPHIIAQDAVAKEAKEIVRNLGITTIRNVPISVFNAVIIDARQILETCLNSSALFFQNNCVCVTKYFCINKTSFSISQMKKEVFQNDPFQLQQWDAEHASQTSFRFSPS